MSHFTVAIITKGLPTKEEIKKALMPYQEYDAQADFPREYLNFHSLSKKYKETYETGTSERVRLKDGTLVYPWNVKQELETIGAKLINVPWKELYSTFEEYLEEYHGAEKDEETNDYGYWENPNAKWDWYQIGGRWAGMLKVAPNCKNCRIGEKSFFLGARNPYTINNKYRTVDIARIKDLVFPDYQKEYDKAKRFWELKIENQAPENNEEAEMLKFDFYSPEYYTKTYKNKETYAECEATFNTYAVIDKNGKWIARGKMGFWGVSREEENQVVDYIKNYKKNVFDVAEEDDYITIVDCHI